jgi:hypothetical protein
MKKYIIRTQIVELGTEDILAEQSYPIDDYPDYLTDWVEREMEDKWEERLEDDIEY